MREFSTLRSICKKNESVVVYPRCREASKNAGSWCSGLTCHSVTVEIGGSNPLGPANFYLPAQQQQPDRGSWCSGLTCHSVTVEIGGSNPLGPARRYGRRTLYVRILF